MGCGGKLTGAEKTRVALQMRRLLLAEWRARRPNIVITVTGGAKAFTCSKLLKKRFKHGLIRAAQNTGTSEMGQCPLVNILSTRNNSHESLKWHALYHYDTGAWILTGGMNAGVMKLVGNAVSFVLPFFLFFLFFLPIRGSVHNADKCHNVQ